MTANASNCLLCSGKILENAAHLNGREIRALWREFGQEFPPEALVGIGEDSVIILWRCEGCGFEFFDPALAGNSLFYQCLESGEYYTPGRTEFQRTVRMATRAGLNNVLDIGCGAGDFLDLARKSGLKTFGLELNPTAAAKSRMKGHMIFDQLLPDMPADACPGGFDLITLFQVLEHVPDPISVLNQAAARLKPGGYISIAVPSKSGMHGFIPWNPAQWPPHHISHWRLRDFKTLSQRTGLHLVESGGDKLLGMAIEQAILARHKSALALDKLPRTQVGSWPRFVTQIYRKCGLKFITPRWGPSIYAYLRKV